MDAFLDYLKANLAFWLLLLGAVSLAIFIWWRYGRQIRLFIMEVKVELLKASWPWELKEKGMKKYKELTDSTLVVIIATLLMGGYVAVWDFVMVNIVGFLTKH